MRKNSVVMQAGKVVVAVALLLAAAGGCGGGTKNSGEMCSLTNAGECKSGICLSLNCPNNGPTRVICATSECDTNGACTGTDECLTGPSGTKYCVRPAATLCQ